MTATTRPTPGRPLAPDLEPGSRADRHAGALAAIPRELGDLVEAPRVVALTTLMPDGRPQTSAVWCDFDGTRVRLNCMRDFRKTRNMRADPRVTLLCYDPRRPLRFLEIRGDVVEMTEQGAAAHLDDLASKYMGRPARYFGDCVPAELAASETPVLIRVAPRHVVGLDAEGGSACGRCDADDRRGGASNAAPIVSPAGDRPALPEDVPLPTTHLDLLGTPNHAVLTTLMPEGRPQSSLVWLDHDGACARVNTTLERQKGRNMATNPAVSLLVVDADDTGRYVQIRGDAELVTDRAVEHLDALTRAYTRHPCYYGHIYPEAQRERETRVIARVHPRRISLDAIHH